MLIIMELSPTTTKPTSLCTHVFNTAPKNPKFLALRSTEANTTSQCSLFARLDLYSNGCATIAPVGFIRTRCFASSQPQQEQEHRSFVVSYLVNTCGLSPESADIVATKQKLKFQSSQNPDSVVALLTNHGFSTTEISKLVRVKPTLLACSPDKILLPKLQFFNSIGISGSNLASIVSSSPILLESSLEKQLVPCYKFLKTAVHLQDQQVIAALKRSYRFLTTNVPNTLSPNVSLLRQLGMPQPLISVLFTRHPRVATLKHDRFVKAVEDTKQMGFNPSKGTFLDAMSVLPTMTQSKWESKFEVFGKWGWSKEDTLATFRIYPLVMTKSEKKIMETMDFLVNKMGWAWASKQVAERPEILNLSLENNIVPKCYVIHVLQLKGLVKRDIKLGSIFVIGEKRFFDRYVTKFQESVPQLLDLYEGKVDLQDCVVSFAICLKHVNC